MTIIKRFEDLEVWKTSRKLTKEVYYLTIDGAFSMDFGLRDQIRRSAVSLMSNIAEGFDSETQALFITYLGRARASAGELRCQLYIARDIGYITDDQLADLLEIANECGRQLFGFIKYLRSRPNTKRTAYYEN
jgi:four helix bundle protein